MERIDENQTQEEQSYGRSYKRHLHHKRKPASARRKTMIFGFLVVVFGTTWLLENLGVISKDISRVIISWPSVLIAVGLINLVNGMGRFFGVILILAGAFWHSTLYFEYNFN
ncbi:MAG: DUF5668 domain-containing protein, partial [Bacteroidales bacterium]|nr:DUF5668 domain-containing protein [Bacteroidales bacterium]